MRNTIKPKLYILCGLSFAGKSTLARRLAQPLGAAIVEADDYIEVVRPNTLSKVEEWRAIQKLARGKVKELLEAGENVIFDDLMVDPINRVEMAQLAGQCGAAALTIFLNTSPETVRQRQQQQSPTEEQQVVYDQHTELLLSQLVPPPQEEAVYVQPGYDFSAVLEEITRRCR
jgi:predicted kinase